MSMVISGAEEGTRPSTTFYRAFPAHVDFRDTQDVVVRGHLAAGGRNGHGIGADEHGSDAIDERVWHGLSPSLVYRTNASGTASSTCGRPGVWNLRTTLGG